MCSPGPSNLPKERELEKVNAFYLQKEAEVRTILHSTSRRLDMC